ncbi:MAG: hypothetical protein ACOX1V_02205 [Candidatus Iainarchaeum sp.]|nr:MAG: The GLUG motif protein [archaeon ADurb.Bin336]
MGLINVLIRGETNVGSIVGQSNFGCFVTNSFSKGDVNGFNNVGGLMGSSYNGGSIINSYFMGDVNGSSSVGGIAGELYGSGDIISSYSVGDIFGSDFVGGLVGYFNGGAVFGGSVSNSFSTSKIIGSGNVGGLIGYDGSSISSSYWDTVLSGQTNCYYDGTEGCTSTNDDVSAYYGDRGVAKLTSEYSWIVNNWVARDNNYPILAWQQ